MSQLRVQPYDVIVKYIAAQSGDSINLIREVIGDYVSLSISPNDDGSGTAFVITRWEYPNVSQPKNYADILARMDPADLNRDYVLRTIRNIRNYCLANTDAMMVSDYPITPADKLDLIAYRQALRNLPADYRAGKLTLPADISDISIIDLIPNPPKVVLDISYIFKSMRKPSSTIAPTLTSTSTQPAK